MEERAKFVAEKYPDFPKGLISKFINIEISLEENLKSIDVAFWEYVKKEYYPEDDESPVESPGRKEQGR